jgi:hypothetical protein
MSCAKLLHLLARCAADRDRHADTRQIIRFKDRREYNRFVRQLQAGQPTASLKASIRKLPLIHAVSFRGRALPPQEISGVSFIEQDMRIRMHGVTDTVELITAKPPVRIPWGIRRIRAPKVWKYTTGQAVKVAVIDTGADFHHPALRHALDYGVNLLHRRTLPWDDNGHGTHIAGTIAAAAADGRGIWGTAPNTIICPVKAFDMNGSAYVSDIIEGIDWCVRNGVRVINMSFGMSEPSRAFMEAVRNAHRLGVIIVASAGNDGKQRGALDYPAQYPGTIAVGSTGRNGRPAAFSNRGKGVFLYAPGQHILSTWLNQNYAVLSGTSMSTSHVSGAIALALSLRSKLTPDRIRQLLYATGRPLKGHRTGRWREIDVFRLIKAVRRKKYESKSPLTSVRALRRPQA